MEITRVRQPYAPLGQEKYQMLELNRRLESYLNHVKLLEEENALLRGEIQTLRKNREPQRQRRVVEEALREARMEVEVVWREKDRVEMEIGNMGEEFQALSLRRQMERDAQEEVCRRLAESRKELEEERRAQIWLREKAAQLETELQLQVQLHQEDVAGLKASLAQIKPAPMVWKRSPPLDFEGLSQQYSQQVAQVWQEAVENYQKEVNHLEESLTQAKAQLAQIVQEKKEGQLHVQNLAKELESAQTKWELLEKNVVQHRDRQNQELQQLKAHVDGLEAEKAELGEQIHDIIKETQNLLQLKMSLGLEVSTYRALLDSESTRANNRSAFRSIIQTPDTLSKPNGVKPGFQTPRTSCHVITPITTAQRSSLYSKVSSTKMTAFQTSPCSTSFWETPKRVSVTKEEQTSMNEESHIAGDWSTPDRRGPLNGTGSVDHFRPEDVCEEVSYAAPLSAFMVQPTFSSNTAELVYTNNKSDLEEVKKQQTKSGENKVLTDESAELIAEEVLESVNVTDEQLNRFPQTRAVSPGPMTENKKEPSQDSKDKETEKVQISWEAQSMWEDINAEKEKEKEREDLATNMDSESENVTKHDTSEHKSAESESNILTEFDRQDKNSDELDTSFTEQVDGCPADTTVQSEKFSADFMLPEAQDNKNDFADGFEEQQKVESESDKDTFSEWGTTERLEAGKDKMEDVSEQTRDVDMEVQVEEDERETEKKQTMAEERIKETVTNMDVEQRDAEEKTAVLDEYQANIENEAADEPFVKWGNSEINSGVLEKKFEQKTLTIDEKDFDVCADNNKGEEKQSHEEEEEEDSPNISASWRTDPGECDSYALQNTLADTRPLIRYKSDDTDVNTQTSHQGATDSSESEEDREAGVGHWGINKSKRFDTMEDLSEEPEIEIMDEMVSEEPVLSAEGDTEQEYVVLKNEQDDRIVPQAVMEDTGHLEESRSEKSLTEESEEDNNIKKEVKEEEDQEKEKKMSELLCWSENFIRETMESETAGIAESEHQQTVKSNVGIAQEGPADIDNTDFPQSQQEGETVQDEKIYVEHVESSFSAMSLTESYDQSKQTDKEICETSQVGHLEEGRSETVLGKTSEQFGEDDYTKERLEEQVDQGQEEENLTGETMDSETVHIAQSEHEQNGNSNVAIAQEDPANIDNAYFTHIQQDNETIQEEMMQVKYESSLSAVSLTESYHQSKQTDKEICETSQVGHLEEGRTEKVLTEQHEEDKNTKEGLEEEVEEEENLTEETMDSESVCIAENEHEQIGNSNIAIAQEDPADTDKPHFLHIEQDIETIQEEMMHVKYESSLSAVSLTESYDQSKQTDKEICETSQVGHLEEGRTEKVLTEQHEEDKNTKEGLEEEEEVEVEEEENLTEETMDSEPVCIAENEHEQIGNSNIAIAQEDPADIDKPHFLHIEQDIETIQEEMMHVKYESSLSAVSLTESYDQSKQTDKKNCEPSQVNTTDSDESSEETAPVKDTICQQDDEDEQNLSMLTNIDFTDNISVPSEVSSRPESQANTTSSDVEDSQTSEDESPNASQCSQSPNYGGMMTDELHPIGIEASVGILGASTDNLELERTDREETQEGCELPQMYPWDNLGKPSQNTGVNVESATQNIHTYTDERFGRTEENTVSKPSETLDIFQGNRMEVPSHAEGNVSDLFGVFSTNFKQEFWSTTTTAATYDPEESEQYTHATSQSNQSLIFREPWGDLENLPKNDGKSEREAKLSVTSTLEREEQTTLSAKQLSRGDNREGETVLSDDSDEGNSWSSGEE
ncbi:nestin [Chanos chanos]|uniref:Nestin n=1 Tax=Chanos chanos TaxID=29144 RepID=A0A6J2W168_CHACN|nr:nestin [Chanos chanos]